MLGILRDMNIPTGIVINRDGIGDDSLIDTYHNYRIPIMLRVPFDRALAENLAAGRTLVDIYPKYLHTLQELYWQITQLIGRITK